MNEPAKLTKSKDVIAYLAEQFPQCFSVKGDAKPLKIGIFDDLAKRLQDDPMVSKTRLRTALRHYTNSWRYLYSVKQGEQRVDLDGNPVEPVTEEHYQHAQESLKESKAKVAEKNKARKQAQQGEADTTAQQKRTKRAKVPAKSTKPSASKTRKKTEKPAPKLNDVELNTLSVGQQVQVKAGNQPMPAIVTEIDKDDIQVRLENGLSMKVKIANVFVAAE